MCVSCVKHSEFRVYTWSSVNISTRWCIAAKKNSANGGNFNWIKKEEFVLSFPFSGSLPPNKSQRSSNYPVEFPSHPQNHKNAKPGWTGFCAFHFIFLRSPLGMWLLSGHHSSFGPDAGEREHFTASIWDPGLLLWIKERFQTEQSSVGLFQRRFLGDIASYRMVLLKLRRFLVFPSVFCIYLICPNYVDRLLLLGFRKAGDCFPFQSSLLIYDIKNQNLQGLSAYQGNEAKWSIIFQPNEVYFMPERTQTVFIFI